MMYAAYRDSDFICNVSAENDAEALAAAQALNPETTRVEPIPDAPMAA